ncbi:MAG TPA: hypothetical protein VF219_05625 [Vicinamibacterales bacterium]
MSKARIAGIFYLLNIVAGASLSLRGRLGFEPLGSNLSGPIIAPGSSWLELTLWLLALA